VQPVPRNWCGSAQSRTSRTPSAATLLFKSSRARSRTSRMPSATTLLFDYSRSSWFVDGRQNARTDASSRVETDEVESVGLAEQLLRCAISIHPRGNDGQSGRQLVPSRVRSGQQCHCGCLLAASCVLHSWELHVSHLHAACTLKTKLALVVSWR